MPIKARKPCKYPGCPNLTDRTYCPEHSTKVMLNYNRYRRDPESAKRYDGRWKKIRATYVKLHPLCEDCLKRGEYVPVEEVHHIIPLSQGGTNDMGNLISLCQSCHTKRDIEAGVRRIF